MTNKDESRWFDEHIHALYELRDILYSFDSCICGGPLHILLDDGNVRDSDIEFCREQINNKEWVHVREVCTCILNMLKILSPAQRYYWWEYMSIEDIINAEHKELISTPNGYRVQAKEIKHEPTSI